MQEEQERKIGRIASSLGVSLEVINLADIELSGRYRQEYGDLQELAESIKTRGQLQNLVVTRTTNGEENSPKYKLLAGGRRYKAMCDILCYEQAFALVSSRELDDLELLEIEWEENAKRKDFSWQEAVKLKQKIHDLRVEKYGEKFSTVKTTDPTLTGVSIADTAELLGESKTTFTRDLNLARAVEKAPEIFASAKNKHEAEKLLKRALQAINNHEVAKEIQSQRSTAGLSAQLQSLLDRYILRDFFEGVKELPDHSIDFCEIDPPYSISLQEIKQNFNSSYNTTDYNEIQNSFYMEFIEKTISECWRVMKENSSLILWHAPEPWSESIYQALKKTGFQTTRLTGKWIKPTGQCNQPQKWLANCCEEFFYAHKGNSTLIRQGRSNVFQFNYVHPDKKIHPAERPAELIRELLSIFASVGARILVPFAGSGRTLIEAELLNMTAIGFDISKAYKDSYTITVYETLKGAKENA